MEKIPRAIVKAEVCGTCIHYRQHYVLDKHQMLTPLWYGHCKLPKCKHPSPDETCDRWEERRDDGS